jgi:hypothetical protein
MIGAGCVPLPCGACRKRNGRPWRRRIERHLAEARPPAGKTLATFDFEVKKTENAEFAKTSASGNYHFGSDAQ